MRPEARVLEWTEYVKFFVALFVIADPIGAIPLFLGVTAEETASRRNRTAHVVGVAVAVAFVASALAGQHLLRLFGITMPSFRIGAGILVLLMAIDMLNARMSGTKSSPEEAREAESRDSVAVVPLAIPLVAGPAAMSTVILYAQHSHLWMHRLMVCMIAVLVAGVTWMTLRLAGALGRHLGKTGVNIASRVMGLLLAAVAVEFIANGAKELFPVLMKGP